MRSTASNSVTVALVVCAVAVAHAQPRRDAPAAPMSVERREVEMVVGEQLTIPTAGLDQYSPGVPGVVDVKISPRDPSHVVLLALEPGVTTLLLLLEDGTGVQYWITVLPRERSGAVTPRDNIRLDFYFVELRSRGGYQVGLAWPGTAAGTGALQASTDITVRANLRTSRVTSATATIAGQVLPRLDLAQAAGWARVLRHSSLTMTNGETANFSSGGEVNVRVGNGLAVGLEQIQHGTRLQVVPRYDRQTGRIELRVAAEVATLSDPALDGLPGRDVTAVDTLVNLELGEAIVLAGLLGDSSTRDAQGLPWLSQVPVIGYLFGTHGAAYEHVENVLVIVPTVADAIDAERRDLVDEALSAYRAFEGEFAAPLSGARTEEATR